jgi:hypothetical protein
MPWRTASRLECLDPSPRGAVPSSCCSPASVLRSTVWHLAQLMKWLPWIGNERCVSWTSKGAFESVQAEEWI